MTITETIQEPVVVTSETIKAVLKKFGIEISEEKAETIRIQTQMDVNRLLSYPLGEDDIFWTDITAAEHVLMAE